MSSASESPPPGDLSSPSDSSLSGLSSPSDSLLSGLSSPSDSLPRGVVERYFAAVDAEDFDTLRTLLHPDVALTACGSRPRRGAEAVIAMFALIFERFPQHSDRPTRLITDGTTVVAEIHFEGTSAGGVAITFEAVDVFDIADGRIVRLTQWFDSADLQRQLRGPSSPDGPSS